MVYRTGLLAIAAALALPANSLTPAERQANAESFEHVWQTVRDKRWDAAPSGVDWQAVHDELRPKLDRAASQTEARAVISEMLGRLKLSHYGIIPREAYGELDTRPLRAAAPSATSDATPGIDVRVVDGHALVVAVDPGSPAAARGVKPGWELLRVDGKEIAPSLEKIRNTFASSTLLDLISMRSIEARLSGDSGKPVNVVFADGGGREVALQLERAAPRGALAKLGYLPPVYFWVESKKPRPDIGYVRFSLFMQPDTLVSAFHDAVSACKECRGFVIDLRGNPGGIGGLAMGVAGWFVDKSGLQLGVMSLRGADVKFVVFPRPEPFRGPLAILVDGCSASTSEILAGGLKDIGRARIFGTRTAGAALPSIIEMLPNGDGFQYAIANYISQGGKPLEGIGVIPDEEARPTRAALLAGTDSALDSAIAWIDKQEH